MKKLLYSLSIILCFLSCNQQTQQVFQVIGNPPAAGFDVTNSDEKAILIADQVMEAMGGRQNWEGVRILKWNFFGSRKLVWDKHTGQVRIDFLKENLKIILNLHNKTGKAMRNDSLFTQGPVYEQLMEKGESVWINDSYWLVLPFKLKDSGVTLKYIGEANTQAGTAAEVLQLTYNDIGKTPDNKYLVYVDKQSHLITQWDYYPSASDDEPKFQIPWNDYQQYGPILLSGDRGKNSLTEIEVWRMGQERLFVQF